MNWDDDDKIEVIRATEHKCHPDQSPYSDIRYLNQADLVQVAQAPQKDWILYQLPSGEMVLRELLDPWGNCNDYTMLTSVEAVQRLVACGCADRFEVDRDFLMEDWFLYRLPSEEMVLREARREQESYRVLTLTETARWLADNGCRVPRELFRLLSEDREEQTDDTPHRLDLVGSRQDGPAESPSVSAGDAGTKVIDQYVNLNQAAALVNRKKVTLLRALNKPGSTMPQPDTHGCGGKPHEWLWPRLRPWLEQEYGKSLPERFPT
jgi:hypothetical protein